MERATRTTIEPTEERRETTVSDDNARSSAVELRPYQVDAIERVRGQARRGIRRVLVVAPTGAGKTVVAATIVRSAYERGNRAIVFAHRRELIDQTYRKLVSAGIRQEAIGVIMASDKRRNDAAPIQVASIDSFRHRECLPADLIIVDEAHRSLSRSYLEMLENYPDAVVLGLTATPYRSDGAGLGVIYKALEVVATPEQLIKEGFLAEPRVFAAAEKPDLRGVRVRSGDYVESDLADACGRLVGGIVPHWQRLAAGMRTVAFAVTVAHSQAIVASFIEAGVTAEHLDGETPPSERDAILARLERGETLVVSNCNVLSEGWDQPAVKCTILARPTMSTGLYLQQAGRILRPWEGVRPVILDHAGNALAHGLPQDTRTFALDAKPAKKCERGTGNTKQCPACAAIIAHSHRECPECEYRFERIDHGEIDAAGELVEIDLALHAHKLTAWKTLCEEWRSENDRRINDGRKPIKPGAVWHRFRERFGMRPPAGCTLPFEIANSEEKTGAFEELRAEAAERGYRTGWALHRFRQRFGHFPARARGAA